MDKIIAKFKQLDTIIQQAPTLREMMLAQCELNDLIAGLNQNQTYALWGWRMAGRYDRPPQGAVFS